MSQSRNYERLEKEHLRQLLNTRAEIIHELQASDAQRRNPYGTSSSLFSSTAGSGKLPKIYRESGRASTTAGSRRPRSVVDEAVSLSLTAPPPANLMLSFRQLGASRAGKREKTKEKEKGKDPQVVRLPIFRLPSANTQALEQAHQLELARLGTQQGQRRKQFLSFSDYKTMKKALLVMLQLLNEEEKENIASWCRVRLEDFDDALFQLKKRFGDTGSTSSSSSSSSHFANAFVDSPHIMEDFFAIDEASLSHFFAAKAKASSAQNSNLALSSSQQAKTKNLADSLAKQKESLRTLSAGMNLNTLGISSPFQEFLLADNLRRQKEEQREREKLHPNLSHSNSSDLFSLPSITLSRPATQAQSRQSHSRSKLSSSRGHSHSQSLSHMPNLQTLLEIESKTLTGELMSSLLAVQKHRDHVKRTLEDAQALIAAQADDEPVDSTPFVETRRLSSGYGQTRSSISRSSQPPHTSHGTSTHLKAREALHMLAAERLSVSLYKLVLVDMRRGLIAWRLAVKQQRRSERVYRLLRALIIRNILLGVQRLVHKRLREAVIVWHETALKETQRLRKVRILKAAITIQSTMRRALAAKKVKFLRQRKKYERLYDSTIKIQALFRGKLQRWKYLQFLENRKRQRAAVLIQRIYRGYCGRRRAAALRFRQNRNLAATMIQCMIRCHFAREKMRQRRRASMERAAAIKLQKLVRGFVGRRNIAIMFIDRARRRNAIKIQAIVRGALTRMNIERKIREIQEYRKMRQSSAVKVQSLYRGYRTRIIFKIMLLQRRKEMIQKNQAANQINRIVRGFLARRMLVALKEERFETWVMQAKRWQEMWSDDSQTWFYFNKETNEALWEPSREGYTKSDGKLVLCSGEIIEDPTIVEEVEHVDDVPFDILAVGEQKKKKLQKKPLLSKLCSECSQNVAIRKCNECGDQFCTRCYKATHNIGSRRNHTYTSIGPKSCDDCEICVAERFCVACDENFCDKCWRKLHSHGKRVFHPFCEISAMGRVDPRILTMDGEQLEGSYDVTYAQQRAESQELSTFAETVSHQQQLQPYTGGKLEDQSEDYFPHEYNHDYDESTQENDNHGYIEDWAGGDESTQEYGLVTDPWTMYYDDNNYPYYYNSITGVSQYESPYE